MIRGSDRVRRGVPGVSRRVRRGGRIRGHVVARVVVWVNQEHVRPGLAMDVFSDQTRMRSGERRKDEVIRTEISRTAHSNTVTA